MPHSRQSNRAGEPVVVEGMGTFIIEKGLVLQFDGEGTHVEVPEGVTGIGEYAFVNCDKIETLVLPESVMRIQERAFSYCNRLRRINLPAGLTSIGPAAFHACHSLEEIEIPSGVTEIGKGVFRYCGIKRVNLPEGLHSIGISAFANCWRLEAVSFPESLRKIKESAFASCEELEKVTGLEQVESVATDAFYNCRKLADANGLLISGTTLVSAFLEGVKQLVIPTGITAIGESALYDTDDLETIEIPETVTEIGHDFLWNPFSDMGIEKLRTLILPANMTTLERTIMLPPDLLERLQAPGLSMEELKERMLLTPATVGYLCAPEVYTDPEKVATYRTVAVRKKSLVIPMLLKGDRVAGIATYAAMGKITPACFERDFMEPALEAGATQCIAFLMNWRAENIRPEAEERRLRRELNKDIYNASDMKKLWSCKKQDGTWMITGYKGAGTALYIPPRIGRTPVTAIGPDALNAYKPGRLQSQRAVLRSVTAVTIPEGVTTIGDRAFAVCDNLTDLTIPETVATIGKEAFAKCDGLKTVKLPESLTNIGELAFEFCTALTDVTIPAGVTAIGKNTFVGCDNLTVHGRAGSFAEIYAKERNIPFVAE